MTEPVEWDRRLDHAYGKCATCGAHFGSVPCVAFALDSDLNDQIEAHDLRDCVRYLAESLRDLDEGLHPDAGYE